MSFSVDSTRNANETKGDTEAKHGCTSVTHSSSPEKLAVVVDKRFKQSSSSLTQPEPVSGNAIMEQLEFQTSLLSDMQKRIEELTANKVDRLKERGREPAPNNTHVRTKTKHLPMEFSVNSSRNNTVTKTDTGSKHCLRVGSKEYIRKKQVGIKSENKPSAAKSEKEPNVSSDGTGEERGGEPATNNTHVKRENKPNDSDATGKESSSSVLAAESALPAKLFLACVQVMDENHRLIEVSALASVSVCTVFL
jgi:hypothetical protein